MTQPAYGFQLPNWDIRARNARTGGEDAVKGDVVMLDLHRDSAQAHVATNSRVGDDESSLASFSDNVDTDSALVFGIFGVCLDDITNGQWGRVRLQGHVDAKVGSGGVSKGQRLTPVAGVTVRSGAAGASDKVVAIALEDITQNTTGSVLFSGVWPLGSQT